MKNEQNNTGLEVAKALATASQTPFKTAFKVTMGVFLAQVVIGFAAFFGFMLITIGLYFLYLLV